MGYIAIPKLLIKHYKQLGLSSDELIFLGYLLNITGDIILNIEHMANELELDTKEILNLVQTLKEKDIINVLVNKNDKKVINEYIILSPFYDKLANVFMDYINNHKSDKDHSYIFETFEKEFGRSLSPMEYEIINAWIESNIAPELIIEALKEATFNGVANLRYIDKIIYEWHKKGFKNVNDIKQHHINRREKKEKVEIFDYNWLEDDEDHE